jgi:hypothetical protein
MSQLRKRMLSWFGHNASGDWWQEDRIEPRKIGAPALEFGFGWLKMKPVILYRSDADLEPSGLAVQN